MSSQGRTTAEAVSRWLPTTAAQVRAQVWHVGFVVEKMAPGQVFSEYFGFPCQPHFIPPTSPSSQSTGTGIIGQYMATVRRGPSMDSTSHNSNKKKVQSSLWAFLWHGTRSSQMMNCVTINHDLWLIDISYLTFYL
jgi:hypothetical protein